MKAIVQTHYGQPEDLQLKEVAMPEPKAGQVRIRVKATAINDYDWSVVTGKPAVYRLLFGLRRPRRSIPGMEVAGVVDAAGPGVTRFKAGDAVYGDTSAHGLGTFAEYVCVHENGMQHKPEELSFIQAAAVPHAFCLANQGLQLGGFKPGMNILINGAGGGVGMFALHLAKQFGATVTGVDTSAKLEKMQALGFDHVIDYKSQDFTTTGKRYDLVLDAKSTRPPSAIARALSAEGVYVTVGGEPALLFRFLFTGKRFRILAIKTNNGLADLQPLLAKGVRPVIDGPYPLEDVPRLIRYFGEGRHFGKVVVEV
jgi:NADPH:quinone reductase-like Zn-dependent oxidoreductase